MPMMLLLLCEKIKSVLKIKKKKEKKRNVVTEHTHKIISIIIDGHGRNDYRWASAAHLMYFFFLVSVLAYRISVLEGNVTGRIDGFSMMMWGWPGPITEVISPECYALGFYFFFFSSQEASVTVWSGLMDALLNSSDGAKRSSCILLIFWLLVVSSSIFASSSFCFLPWRGFRLLRKTSADENWSLNNKVLPPFNANSIFGKGVDSKKLERQFWTSSSTRKKETLGRSLPWVVRIAVIFPILKGEREWKDLKVCSCESTELEKQFPSLLLFQQCREKSTFLFPSLGTFSCFCFSSFFFFFPVTSSAV